MNRRNFCSSTLLGGSVLLSNPILAFSKNSNSLSRLGKGFGTFDSNINSLTFSSLQPELQNYYLKVAKKLKTNGFILHDSNLLEYSQDCYMIPYYSYGDLGFDKKQGVAFIVKDGGHFDHVILDTDKTASLNIFLDNIQFGLMENQHAMPSPNKLLPIRFLTKKNQNSVMSYQNASGKIFTLLEKRNKYHIKIS